MAIQDILALVGMIAGALAVPAAWVAYQSSRKQHRIDAFRCTITALRNEHATLTRKAFEATPSAWKLPDLPLLGLPSWIPTDPLDLDDVLIEWREPGSIAAVNPRLRRLRDKLLKGLGPGVEGESYSSTLVNLGVQQGLFNGRIYRPLSITVRASQVQITCTLGRYFDYLDTSEVLAFETRTGRAERALKGKYRLGLGNPFDLQNRVASLGVDTLTVRVDNHSSSFILHQRDSERITHNSNLLGTAPAGEFAPSDVTHEALRRDLDLWHNIMREYAEEFLGLEEAQGRGGSWIDYENDHPYKQLNEGKRAGKIRVKVLGVGLDPLTWKPELLTVCLIDADIFDDVFRNMVSRNDEGLLIFGRRKLGLRFDWETVSRYISAPDISPSAETCLTLAWRHRSGLGLGADDR